ncbi:hypothetical protein [Streptosporangium roseum]|uniref:hypothetical protein n=1 Tax=Streptosporangium roseum TaxID=2001 RepID=UPI0033190305
MAALRAVFLPGEFFGVLAQQVVEGVAVRLMLCEKVSGGEPVQQPPGSFRIRAFTGSPPRRAG